MLHIANVFLVTVQLMLHYILKLLFLICPPLILCLHMQVSITTLCFVLDVNTMHPFPLLGSNGHKNNNFLSSNIV